MVDWIVAAGLLSIICLAGRAWLRGDGSSIDSGKSSDAQALEFSSPEDAREMIDRMNLRITNLLEELERVHGEVEKRVSLQRDILKQWEGIIDENQ